MRDSFNLFDTDKSGSISVRELKNVCKQLDLRARDEELESMMKLMDKDGSQTIDFDEFANVMASQFYRTPSESELNAAFDYFDKGLFVDF